MKSAGEKNEMRGTSDRQALSNFILKSASASE